MQDRWGVNYKIKKKSRGQNRKQDKYLGGRKGERRKEKGTKAVQGCLPSSFFVLYSSETFQTKPTNIIPHYLHHEPPLVLLQPKKMHKLNFS